MNKTPKPRYYWAKFSFNVERSPAWEIVEVRDSGVWIFGNNQAFDLQDFTFGPEITKPEGLE